MIRLTLLLSLALAACGRQDRPARQGPFYALESFLDGERERYAQGMPVRKTVTLGANTETQEMPDYTWSSELDLLAQWDLNRPAWFDQYQRDSMPYGQGGWHYSYLALEEDLPIHEFQVWRQGDRPDSLRILTRVSNPLHTTTGEYFYQPGRQFVFRQENRRRFGKDQLLEVSVRALP